MVTKPDSSEAIVSVHVPKVWPPGGRSHWGAFVNRKRTVPEVDRFQPTQTEAGAFVNSYANDQSGSTFNQFNQFNNQNRVYVM